MMQIKQTKRLCWLAAVFVFFPLTLTAGKLDQAVRAQANTDKAAQESQQTIDRLDDETQKMLNEYREISRQTDSLKSYNDQLERVVKSQKAELESIQLQLDNIEATQRNIVPLMMQMVAVLEQFVSLDVPFLPDERQQRIAALKSMMNRADVSLAEKYRRIIEAYQVETEYGRTIEAYQDALVLDEQKRTVDLLRIGRVSLYYLTLDGQQAGVWDMPGQQWQTLDDSYLQAIADGLKVARKQLPPDLLVLPVKTSGGQ